MRITSRVPAIPLHRIAAVSALLASACSAAAGTYQCSLVAPSSANNIGQLSLPLNGTFIGNYDAATNPGGTQTRPGFFGGSGNNPISYTSTITGDLGFAASPDGSFAMEIAPTGGSVSGLQIDLTGGTAQEFDVTLNINYQTFRTIAPNSTFPGGFTIPVPIATGEITAMVATQSGAAAIVPGTPDAEGTPFTALVPVTITLEAAFAGSPVEIAPQSAVLPLNGRYTVTGSAIRVTASLSIDQQTLEIPPGPPIQNQPLALPTVLPAGGTANLLLSGTFGTGSYTSGLSASLVADGQRQNNGDINGDGVVNGLDLAAVLGAWGSAQAGADINGDGVVNGVDLTILLANWG